MRQVALKQIQEREGEGTAGVVPLYHRVYTILSQQIREGLFDAETPLPGEQQLAQQYNVSRVTIRKALQRLENEGRILRQRGRGTYPIPEPKSRRQRKLIDQMTVVGDTETELLTFDWVPPSPEAASALGIPAGEDVLRVDRIRNSGRTPFAFGACWVTREAGELLDRESVAKLPIVELLRERGMTPGRVEQRITATVADASTSSLLKVEAGSPLLMMLRIVYDTDSRPMIYVRSLYRPDRYSYLVTLDPEQQDGAPRWVEIG